MMRNKQYDIKPEELSFNDCCTLLSNQYYGRLGMSLNNQPYVVPMSYVYSDGIIYLHSCRDGKKIKIIENNPQICFEVDFLDNNNWASVLTYGKIKLNNNVEAKQRMFDAFNNKGIQGHGGKRYKRKEVKRMDFVIWEMEIQEITGRKGVW